MNEPRNMAEFSQIGTACFSGNVVGALVSEILVVGVK